MLAPRRRPRGRSDRGRGGHRAGLTWDDLPRVASESWAYLRASWAEALVALRVVAVVAGAYNLGLWTAARALDTSEGQLAPGTLAAVYAVKNLSVIPVVAIATLRVPRLLPS